MRCKVRSMTRKDHDYPTLLKTVRNELGLTQESLAWELGVSFSTVSRWENGQNNPSRLAVAQLEGFCARMVNEHKLKVSVFW